MYTCETIEYFPLKQGLSNTHDLWEELCYPPTFTMLPTIIFGKNTAGAHKEQSKKYKSNLQTLKSRATSNAELNTTIKHLSFLTAGLQILLIW